MVSAATKTAASLLDDHRALMSSMRQRRLDRASVIHPSDHELPVGSSSPALPALAALDESPPTRSTIDTSHVPEAKRAKYEAYYPTYWFVLRESSSGTTCARPVLTGLLPRTPLLRSAGTRRRSGTISASGTRSLASGEGTPFTAPRRSTDAKSTSRTSLLVNA